MMPAKWLDMQKKKASVSTATASIIKIPVAVALSSSVTMENFNDYLSMNQSVLQFTFEELKQFSFEEMSTQIEQVPEDGEIFSNEEDTAMDGVSNYLTLPQYTMSNEFMTGHRIHIIDSSASIHITPYHNMLTNVHTTEPLTIYLANLTSNTAQLKG
jgi:hypothetical protein